VGAYFSWKEPKEFAQKKRKENTRAAFKFTWTKVVGGLLFIGFFMLISYLGAKFPHDENSPPSLWGAFFISVGIVLFFLFVAPVLEAKSSPTRNRIKITKRGIWLLDNKMNRTWRFSDIADFHITKEQVGELSINAIELKDFDGVTISIGISPEINIDMLQGLLSEQIYSAREQIRRSFKGPILYWQMWLGTAMVVLGLSALIILGIASFDMKKRAQDVTFVKDDLKDIKEQYASGNPTTLQEKAFNKVAAKAYFAIHYIINLELLQLRILAGSIGAGIVLFGCSLVLWARNRRIYHRMRRLEVMCLELQTSQSQTKS
jgi:hypothetical protein